MDNMVKELMELAYTIYPKGLSDQSQEYLQSVEYQRLNTFLDKKVEATGFIDSIGVGITAHNGECKFENLSAVLIKDRCVKGRFSSVKGTAGLLFYISVVIPYYIIYEQKENISPKCIADLIDSNFYMSSVSEVNKPFQQRILESAAHFFPNYKLFPADLLNIPVEDIVFNGNGKLSAFKHSTFTNNITFFNAFFSDCYF
jgi:hypothetical protein